MPQHRHEEPLGVGGINRDAGNLLSVTKPQMRPAATGVVRPIYPIADAQIGALEPFSTPHIHNVWIRRCHFHRAHRAGVLRIEDGVPRAPRVVRLPHAAVGGRHVEHVRLRRHTHRAFRATGAKRPNVPPAWPLNRTAGKGGLRGEGARRREARKGGNRHEGGKDVSVESDHWDARKISEMP